MKKLLLFLLIFFSLTNNIFAHNDTLLDCEFLFNENIAESIFTWLIDDNSIVESLMPEADFFQLYKDEKKAYCQELVNATDLTKTEKKVRNAQLYNLDSRDFNFGIIDAYHEDLEIKNLTFGNEVNSTIIKNAGYKFITLNPSVKLNNTIYISPKTNAVRSYHFDIEIPEDYEANDYPETKNGFCKIDYDDAITNVRESMFFNEEYIDDEPYEETFVGEGKFEEKLLTDIETEINDDEITINSNLEVETEYEGDFYKWDTYCCESGQNGCIKYCHDCEKQNTEFYTDRAIFTDNYYVTRYSPKKQENYEIWSEDGLLWIRIFINDSDKYKRVMIDRFLEMENYYSVLRYKFEPYDFLYFEAIPTVENSYERMGKTINETIPSRKFYYKSPFLTFEDGSILFGTDQVLDNINVEFETFFDSEGFFNFGNEKLSYTINLTQKKAFNDVLIKTNQVFYLENETIKVTPILLTDKGMYMDDMTISYVYGDEKITKSVRTNETIEFNYKQEGELVLEYPGDNEYYKTIEKEKVVRRPFILYYLFKLIGI